jgi:ribosomal protein L7/L12
MKTETYQKLVAARDLVTSLINENARTANDPAVPLLGENNLASAVNLLREVAIEAAAVDPVTLLTKEETDFVNHRAAIYAVKSVRNRLGIGLKEAKDIVDQAALKLGIAKQDKDWGIRWA